MDPTVCPTTTTATTTYTTSFILNSYSTPSTASNICTRTPNTLSFFFLQRHPTSIPHPIPQYPGWVQRTTQMGTTANDHNIFFWQVMHNVQQQLNNMMAVMSPTPDSWPGNQLILNNKLQHPGTQYKETKAQSTIISELANNENTLPITLTETHLNEKILYTEIQMKNYIEFRADRTLGRKKWGCNNLHQTDRSS